VAIPLVARITALAPLEELSAEARARLTPEDRIRYRLDPSWFFMHSVRIGIIRLLASVDPWSPANLDAKALEVTEALAQFPPPDRAWPGPLGDDWLDSWREIDPLLECGLAVLNEDEHGDDLLRDDELRQTIVDAAKSEHGLLRRPAIPLANRLGLEIA